MELKKVLDRYLDHLRNKRVSPHTLKAYRLDLNDYLAHLKGEDNTTTLYECLVQATSVDLNTFRTYLGQSAPATIVRKFATLKKFLAWAQKEDLRTKPVPTFPILPKKQPLAPRWLTKNEINELLRKAEKSTQSCSNRNEVMIRLLLNTGIRVGELVALKWEDIKRGRRDS